MGTTCGLDDFTASKKVKHRNEKVQITRKGLSNVMLNLSDGFGIELSKKCPVRAHNSAVKAADGSKMFEANVNVNLSPIIHAQKARKLSYEVRFISFAVSIFLSLPLSLVSFYHFLAFFDDLAYIAHPLLFYDFDV